MKRSNTASSVAIMVAVFAVANCPAANAADRKGGTTDEAIIARDEDVSVTRRAVTLRNGRRLAYTARAGFLPLVNDATGETTAHVYFAAYTAIGSPVTPHDP